MKDPPDFERLPLMFTLPIKLAALQMSSVTQVGVGFPTEAALVTVIAGKSGALTYTSIPRASSAVANTAPLTFVVPVPVFALSAQMPKLFMSSL